MTTEPRPLSVFTVPELVAALQVHHLTPADLSIAERDLLAGHYDLVAVRQYGGNDPTILTQLADELVTALLDGALGREIYGTTPGGAA